jgi:hypothetical protein
MSEEISDAGSEEVKEFVEIRTDTKAKYQLKNLRACKNCKLIKTLNQVFFSWENVISSSKNLAVKIVEAEKILSVM